MLDGYKILTVTHRRTPLKTIGQFIIDHSDDTALRARLASIKAAFHIDELLYLATCNRVIFFFYTENTLPSNFATDFCRQINPDISKDMVENHVMLLENGEAVDHLFKVAASVDSLVVGEREILRQLREAYQRCMDWQLTADHLRIAMKGAVAAAKEVYNKTRLGEKSVSVVSLAIKELLKTHLPRKSRILMIGAGQTNSLVAKFLKKYDFHNVTVFNRSIGNAEKIAGMFENGRALKLADLEDYKEGFDCLITCTGATHAIVDPAAYESLLDGDSSRKIIIDLSVPNNVAASVIEKFDVHYIEIDGLKALANENLSFREQEVSNALELLDSHLEEFGVAARHRRIERALHQIPTEVKAVKERAMNEVFRKEIELLDDPSRQLLERMMVYMQKKCTGIPMKVAKAALVTSK